MEKSYKKRIGFTNLHGLYSFQSGYIQDQLNSIIQVFIDKSKWDGLKGVEGFEEKPVLRLRLIRATLADALLED